MPLHKRRKQAQTWAANVEALESRELRTGLFNIVDDVSDIQSEATPVQLTSIGSMQTAVVTNTLQSSSDVDLYKISLKGGTKLSATFAIGGAGRTAARVDLFNAAGERIATGTNNLSNISIPQDGKYYFGISDDDRSYEVTGAKRKFQFPGIRNQYQVVITTRPGDVGGTTKDAAQLVLQPMHTETLRGTVSGKDSDVYKMSLEQGQFLAVTSSTSNAEIEILGPNGKSVSLDVSSENSYGAWAEQNGEHYIRVTSTRSSSTNYSYQLGVRVIGEVEEQSHQELSNSPGKDDGLHTWLEGDVLHVVGPTGYGFELQSDDWSVSYYGQSGKRYATYTAQNSLALETVLGDIELPLIAGSSLQITTRPSEFGHEFGIIDDVDVNLGGVSLEDIGMLAGGFTSQLTSTFESFGSVSRTPGIDFGIALGSDLDMDMPLSANVPYLYFGVDGGAQANFGNSEVKLGHEGLGIAVDPLDSVMAKWDEYAFGLSLDGRFEYTPTDRPDEYDGELFGHFYGAGSYTVKGIEFEGDVVVDLDADDDGYMLGGLNPKGILSGDLSRQDLARMDVLFSGDLGAAAKAVVSDLALGANGAVNVEIPASVVEFSMPIGSGSVIVDATDGFYFRGGTKNPFENVPVLEQFSSNSGFTVDGHIRDSDDFRVKMTGRFAVGPFDNAKGVLDINDRGITANANINVMGMSVDLRGRIDSGGFDFVAVASLDWGVISGNAIVTMSYRDNEFSFGARVFGLLDLEAGGFGVTVAVFGNFEFTAGDDGIEISGSGRVEGRLHYLIGSSGISLGLNFDNNGLEIDLPLFDWWDPKISW